jgi:peptide/nickel transport system permease protein
MYYVQNYRSKWWGYIGKKALIAVVAFFVISFIFFSLSVLNLPTGNETFSLSPIVTLDQLLGCIEEYHLRDNVITRYFYWMGDIIRGDPGKSFYDQVPIKDLIF